MVEVRNIEKSENLKSRLLVKLESFNPGGSAKDRIALFMIAEAELHGQLQPGGTIIEPTSGNTGVGLAWIATAKGYKVILTMPETMSIERQKLLQAMGARLVLTSGNKGMKGAIEEAEKLQKSIPGSIIMGQFSNPANPLAHEQTTGPEIWRDTDGKVDVLVAGVGTGGTLCGTARYLKKHNPDLLAVAVEPADSPVLSGGKPGPHRLQGIGAGFVPANYDPSVVNEIQTATYDEAVAGARLLAHSEGILAGISSGAAFSVALKIAKRPEMAGKTIVVVLPDTGERYLSTTLFDSKS